MSPAEPRVRSVPSSPTTNPSTPVNVNAVSPRADTSNQLIDRSEESDGALDWMPATGTITAVSDHVSTSRQDKPSKPRVHREIKLVPNPSERKVLRALCVMAWAFLWPARKDHPDACRPRTRQSR